MVRSFRALVIRFLAVWDDLSQKQLSIRTGMTRKRVSRLLSLEEIEDEDFEKLLTALQSQPAKVEVVTGCIDGLEAVKANTVLSQEEMEEVERGVREGARLLRDILFEIALGSRRLPALEGYPRPADLEAHRWHAGRLWRILETMAEDEQIAVVRSHEGFWSWALMEKVCEESCHAASRDLDRAASLARLAQEIADRVQGPEGWRNRVRGYAAAHPANILRVAGEIKAARAAFDPAKQLWLAGSDPEGVLDPGRLLDLEASLLRDERQFEEALAQLDEAFPLSRCPARILVQKGFTLEVMGDYEQAIETLHQAGPWIDRETDPRLWYQQRFNLGVALCNMNRCSEAAELVVEVHEVAVHLGDDIFLSRLTWLQGRIAARLGHRAEARALLEKARREFASRNMWYNVLLAQLEVAILLLEEGRAGEVKPLARELATTFKSKGIHREALAALRLFYNAAQREEATAELARQVLSFLLRARHDKGLRFTASGAMGATVGVRSTPIVDRDRLAAATIGIGNAAVIEDETIRLAAATIGIGNAAVLDERATPDRGQEAPEIPRDRPAGRGGKQRGGKDDGDKSWTHWTVSCAAPAPGLHGPHGPRLPGMVRQPEAKSPDLRRVDSPMSLRNRLARLFRALSGKSQVEFGESTGVSPKLIALYESGGDRQPSPDTLERLARGDNLTVREGEEVLRFAETLSRPRQRAGGQADIVLDDLSFLISRAYQRLLRLPLPIRAPHPEDLRHAEVLWSVLKELPENQQRAVVTAGPKFQTWSLVVKVGEESVCQASRDLKRAASLARLAQHIADLIPGSEGWRNRVRGLAVGYGFNISRVVGDLGLARTGMERARQLWDSGSDPYGLLDPGRLLDFEASLLRDERRFQKALDRSDEAIAVGRSPGRTRINKGYILEAMGDYKQAMAVLLEAEKYIDRTSEPRLWYQQKFNLSVNLCHLGQYARAADLMEQVRTSAADLGDEIFLIRVIWLEGRIAAGLGRTAEAARLLEQARQEFARREKWYDVALADVEWASLLLAEGETARVKEMAAELVAVFQEKGIHREALAALQLFHEAAEREKATAELARRVLEFLFRARWDEGLRFGAG
jgi:tetratricopeptide (TPR) repeat protein/transcriptional regulator with XRE-family HTH domain